MLSLKKRHPRVTKGSVLTFGFQSSLVDSFELEDRSICNANQIDDVMHIECDRSSFRSGSVARIEVATRSRYHAASY